MAGFVSLPVGLSLTVGFAMLQYHLDVASASVVAEPSSLVVLAQYAQAAALVLDAALE
jgi:hypothetical protein